MIRADYPLVPLLPPPATGGHSLDHDVIQVAGRGPNILSWHWIGYRHGASRARDL